MSFHRASDDNNIDQDLHQSGARLFLQQRRAHTFQQQQLFDAENEKIAATADLQRIVAGHNTGAVLFERAQARFDKAQAHLHQLRSAYERFFDNQRHNHDVNNSEGPKEWLV